MIATQRRTTAAYAGSDNAAAPTFAIMALLTGVFGGGQPDLLCSAAQDASPLSGMVPMYLLMSAFHLAPWLKLISSRRSGGRRSGSGVRHPISLSTNRRLTFALKSRDEDRLKFQME
jgi:hypothetical protein